MAARKWFQKEERKEAKAMAKEKGKFAWSFTRFRGKQTDANRCKEEGFYVGMNLPNALRREGATSKLIHEPKGR